MKIYNPLRWHITKAGDLYFVRRWEVLGWRYIDADGADYKGQTNSETNTVRLVRLMPHEKRWLVNTKGL